VFLLKEFPLVVIAPALKFLTALIFLIAINSLTSQCLCGCVVGGAGEEVSET